MTKSYQQKHGLSVGQWIEVDLRNDRLVSLGYRPKRNWNGVFELKVIALYDDGAEVRSGSLHRFLLPYKVLDVSRFEKDREAQILAKMKF